MTTTSNHDDRIAKMSFAAVYPHYVTKVEKKGRTKAELHQVIEWLTGFDETKLQALMEEKVTFETFFQRATLNPNAQLTQLPQVFHLPIPAAFKPLKKSKSLIRSSAQRLLRRVKQAHRKGQCAQLSLEQ